VEFLRYLTAEATHSFGVLPGGVVADLGHPAEKLERLQLSLLQLGGAALDEIFEKDPCLLESQVNKARVKESVDVQQEFFHVDRLGQEILGSSSKGTLPDPRATQRSHRKNGQELVLGRPACEVVQKGIAVWHADVQDDEVGKFRLESTRRVQRIRDLVG
jgi:hypothetical protein